MKRSVLLVALVTLAACSYQPPTTSTPSTLTPTLTLTPASVNVNAGNPAVFFSANVRNSTETVTWTYSGPGKVTPSGMRASYTPPTKVSTTQSGSLTATLGSTGVTATAPIVIYPANVTPPAEPPPTKPNPPTTPPTDPNPPAEPPATPDLTVTIAEVSPVTLGNDGKANANLNASTKNAPSSATYQWTAEGANAANVGFSSSTSEDTTATFNADGTYTLRLTVTAGSKSATATVEVVVELAPVPQDVVGLWTSSDESAYPYKFTLDLQQTGEDVTGTYNTITLVTGTFDGTELKLEFPSYPEEPINATVSGDTMIGTNINGSVSYSFTATRQATP